MGNLEKTIKNSVISVAAHIAAILLSIINRRVFIMFLDIEYLGYQTLFSNIFALLSVADLGMGQIISFHLYKEINEGNEKEIGRLMTMYKWLYRITALTVLIAGSGCYFLLPYFIKDASAGWDYLHLIYFLQLGAIILGYFFSYKQTIFIVNQKEYECLQVSLIVKTAMEVIQLITLAIFRSYILYLCIALSVNLIVNVIISVKADREYPYLKCKYSVKAEDIKQRNMVSDMSNFLVHRIAYAIYGGTDHIIISAVCGIKTVALYGNYTTIYTAVATLVFSRLLNPVQAAIGNIVHSGRKKEDMWEQFQMFDVFSFFYASQLSLGFLIFFQPAIEIWMGKQYQLSDAFVAVFFMTVYLGAVWEIVYKYRSVFGDFKQDRNFMILSAILNLTVSVIGAQYFGVAGVQLGTLIAFLPIGYGRIRFVIKNFFGKSAGQYLVKHMILFLVTAAEGILCWSITCRLETSIIGIAVRFLLWLCIPVTIHVMIWHKNPYFKELLQYMKFLLNQFISKSRRK